jgi:predicted CoA-substrate-specific enzyme activase
MMITVGIDVGSITTKAAVVKDGELVADKVVLTGYNARLAGKNLFDAILRDCGTGRAGIDKIISTGYGRNSLEFADKAVTEITCHAAGSFYLNPGIRSVIDIGGQDSKAIALNDSGSPLNFVMNDKCAAGTGRFLEVMARALEVDLDNFGDFALKARQPSAISSLCTVFAESEVISLIANGEKRENIIAGIHDAIAARVVTMANRVGFTPKIMMTGGVAKNSGVVRALEQKIGHKIEVSEKSQVTGAIGAAILAQRV